MYTTNNGRTLNVTLKHYIDGVLNFEDLKAEQHLLDWQIVGLQKTATGYGKKIPTSWKVRYLGKLRRIYQDVYSNSGVSYIIVNGKKLYLV
ncbi:hypothetical protein EAMBIBNC_00009 [Citrobacter phage BSwM KMM4]|nr:hypothetical protein [Shigella flexneri]EIH6462401.1 hypothetical protein [Shigella flexneri]EJM9729051.1 hypothetical protein [Shigella flexneri]URY12766.1 hypothetical protein [Shigella phage ESh22]WBF80924.1 hypothetical protein EAMBIBNC_00009 [Citrobacter phage BSwM KMM4]